ncbi:endosomal P24A protein [Chytriomyces sp. MP71]|nr:endosomal P24A protein [Chytriomyces sp. MP71]
MRALIASALVGAAHGFYLPGMAPKNYKKGVDVPLLVNALSSPDSVLPYDFYYEQLHFCEPDGGKAAQSENLGSMLFGDRFYDSRFELKMLVNEKCKMLCKDPIVMPAKDTSFVNDLIKEKYVQNWVIDQLPAAKLTTDKKTNKEYYNMGFDFGHYSPDTKKAYLNNYYDIRVQYNQIDDGNYRVVGAFVYPHSIADAKNCVFNADVPPLELSDKQETKFQYAYSVTWEKSDIPWSIRWEKYLTLTASSEPRIHWFSLINSVVIVLFLSGMVGMILVRALHKDIARYNQLDSQEDPQEDFGWKLVHGDVFRTPVHGIFLSVLVGSGAQTFVMTCMTLLFAIMGFLSPSSRGSLSTIMLVFYVLFGSIAGFVSARIYKMFGGQSWKKNVMLSAFMFPGIIFGIFIILNFFLVGAHSSGAVPFLTILMVFSLWILISAPLCFLGAYFGFKQPKIEYPVRVNQIPRQIPEQVFYLKPLVVVLMGGILPFGAIFIELYFIMNSIWFHKVYYVFGFLFLVFLILIITCSEVAVLLCYFHLCAEDYHWWWKSYFTSGASAFYFYLYGIVYYVTKLKYEQFASTVLYFGWTAVMAFGLFSLTGTIGFVACFLFVRKIYGSIKVD